MTTIANKLIWFVGRVLESFCVTRESKRIVMVRKMMLSLKVMGLSLEDTVPHIKPITMDGKTYFVHVMSKRFWEWLGVKELS